MRVSSILSMKGSTVATTAPNAPVTEALNELRLRGVGALVVSTDGVHIEGIVSEREIVHRLAERGEAFIHEPVEAVMITEVVTCQPDDDLQRRVGVVDCLLEQRQLRQRREAVAGAPSLDGV